MTYQIPERVLRLAKEGGWVGVDLDGTLFTYTEWVGWNVFGEPIQPMIEHVKAWLAAGVDSRIVTAHIGLPASVGVLGSFNYSKERKNTCRVTGEAFSDFGMMLAIKALTLKHVGYPMRVQCFKDVDMIELWDDRAIQVVANTGKTLAEEHEAELSALRGKQFVGTIDDGPRTDIPGN